MKRMRTLLTMTLVATSLSGLAGCAPMLTGQMAEAGYNATLGKIGGGADLSSVGADERQKRIQSVLNDAVIGQEVEPLITAIGEAPKEKSANMQGYVCYEYSAVYSSTEAAVIVSKAGKVVFYGNSRCNAEMQRARDDA